MPVKQIDPEPRGYRPKPSKGEPFFVPGGLMKISVFLGMILAMCGLAVLLSPLYTLGYQLSCHYLTNSC